MLLSCDWRANEKSQFLFAANVFYLFSGEQNNIKFANLILTWAQCNLFYFFFPFTLNSILHLHWDHFCLLSSLCNYCLLVALIFVFSGNKLQSIWCFKAFYDLAYKLVSLSKQWEFLFWVNICSIILRFNRKAVEMNIFFKPDGSQIIFLICLVYACVLYCMLILFCCPLSVDKLKFHAGVRWDISLWR